jgi:hypothetical protein
VNDFVEQGGLVAGTQRSLNTFNDDYAGKTLAGRAGLTYGKLFGDDTGAVQWWQDYDAQNNAKRKTLFGSALTQTEKTEWEKTIVSPRTDPKEVKKNLGRQATIEAQAARRLAAPYLKGGYSQEAIEGALGFSLDDLSAAAAPGAPGAPSAAPGAPQQYREGQTATGQGGQKIIFRNGTWQPISRQVSR